MDAPPTWYRFRGYRHFDRPVKWDTATALVTDPGRVARHSFLPFIAYRKLVPRYDREAGTVVDKERPIAYASHVDSHIFSYYAAIIIGELERYYANTKISESVLAYRSLGKCNIHFAKEAFEAVKSAAPCVTKSYDVSKFFDTMNHEILRQRWLGVLGCDRLPEDHWKVFRAITNFALVDRSELCRLLGQDENSFTKEPYCTPTQFRETVRKSKLIRINGEPCGIPQGSPLSAVLSNVYMIEFDVSMVQLASKIGAKYLRYSDDVLWIVPAQYEEQVHSEMLAAIASHRLELNLKKTETRRFTKDESGDVRSDAPLNYLGFEFDGQKAWLRSQTLSKFYRSLKWGVSAAISRNKKKNPAFVPRRALYTRFSWLGRQNFPSYAKRANKIMKSASLKRQLDRMWKKLIAEIRKRSPS